MNVARKTLCLASHGPLMQPAIVANAARTHAIRAVRSVVCKKRVRQER